MVGNLGGIQLDAVTREVLDRGFVLEFFEAAAANDPENTEVLLQLAEIYARQGRYEDCLRLDRTMTRLCPGEPAFFYNLACSLSLLGRITEAGAALQEAVNLGFDDVDLLHTEDELENLRGSDEFQILLTNLLDEIS